MPVRLKTRAGEQVHVDIRQHVFLAKTVDHSLKVAMIQLLWNSDP
jgi:hypothetical protein